MTDDTRAWTPDLSQFTSAVDDTMTTGRVFGTPYEHEGTLVIPVAKIAGGTGTGGGGGTGSGAGNGSGTGSGRGTGSGAGKGAGRGPAAAPTDGLGADGQAEAQGEAQGEAGAELHGEGSGEGGAGGGGFGLRVKPIGVYVVQDGRTRWIPAVDVNRAVLGGQVAAAVGALALGWALGRRRS
ncbi:hypothetical protein [Paraoerskovia marina]|uniref:Sporulation protein YtfJ (Spore_YtfJ) n=1 Tax=Paraoerskovia marina TaxID=545619 RepID=A0A1H1TM75_9CELL|nr:hypothetical protein [Paraoerskovia marina]SDS61353.1 hypothetical protein SAMN04489860_1945 [Paraoerskovia marina]